MARDGEKTDDANILKPVPSCSSLVRFNGSCYLMPFEIFTADHNTTLSQVASLSRMNLRSPYTDAILADSDVPTLALGVAYIIILDLDVVIKTKVILRY